MWTVALFFQLNSLSKLGYEGYTVIVNKGCGEHKVVCSSEVAEDFVSYEEEHNCPIEEKFFQYMCGKLRVLLLGPDPVIVLLVCTWS